LIRSIAESDDDALTVYESPPKAYLVLLTNGRVSHSFPLRDEAIEVGRDKDNSVVVADQKVSRHHTSLTPIDDTFIIVDRGSANGTYLNGVLISQPVRLKDKDRITIGDTTFLFAVQIPEAEVLDQPAPVPPIFSPKLAFSNSPLQAIGLQDKPIWILIGCLGLIIVGLLLALAVLLGLVLGRSQAPEALMLVEQLGMF
jgi:pSer/pThr/pTyr-binding forkhead associated (FHA) protein